MPDFSAGVSAMGGAPGRSRMLRRPSDVDSFVSGRFLPGDQCVVTTVKCDLKSKYRTIDGRCNNLKHPEWGSASSTYLRLQDPAYDDNIGKPRTRSEAGTPLPSARQVSKSVHTTKSRVDRKHSHMVMQWGQFLDHDITLTPQARGWRHGVGLKESLLIRSIFSHRWWRRRLGRKSVAGSGPAGLLCLPWFCSGER